MVSLVMALGQAAVGSQGHPVELKKLTLSLELSVSVPTNAKRDTEDFPADTLRKIWGYLDSGVANVVTIIPNYQKLDSAPPQITKWPTQ